jgi:ribonuclease P protein component
VSASEGHAPRDGASFRFGRDRRLRRRADFLRVQSAKTRVITPHFVLLVDVQPAASRGPSRLGVVVTKRVGCAVERARVKRLCREAFRTWPGFVPDGIDLVVIARPGAPDLDLADVRAQWSSVRRKVNDKSLKLLQISDSTGDRARS